MIITREIATKVRDVVSQGLVKGVGVAEPGKMCVEAAVCYALGLPHGDDPGCVDLAVRPLKIRLNDKAWSSNEARAQGLRRLAIAQLGSLGAIRTADFTLRITTMTIRTMVPIALRAAARKNPKHSDRLEGAAVRCESEPTRANAVEAHTAAYAAASASAYAAAATYATYATYAADAAAYAADAAASAASAAATHAAAAYAAAAYAAAAYAADAAAASAAAAAYAAAAAAYDQVLSQFAEYVVQILIEMKAPGCEFLDLVPLEVA